MRLERQKQIRRVGVGSVLAGFTACLTVLLAGSLTARTDQTLLLSVQIVRGPELEYITHPTRGIEYSQVCFCLVSVMATQSQIEVV